MSCFGIACTQVDIMQFICERSSYMNSSAITVPCLGFAMLNCAMTLHKNAISVYIMVPDSYLRRNVIDWVIFSDVCKFDSTVQCSMEIRTILKSN